MFIISTLLFALLTAFLPCLLSTTPLPFWTTPWLYYAEELPIYALLSSFHLYLPLCAVHFMSFNMFYLGGEQLSVRWNLGIRGSSTYSQSIGRGRGFEPRNMMVNCMFSEHLLDLHIISRVCFSSYFHTNWRVYSLLDYAHIPSFACPLILLAPSRSKMSLS